MKLTEAKPPTDQSKSINLKEYTPINDGCKPMPHADFYHTQKSNGPSQNIDDSKRFAKLFTTIYTHP